MVNMENRVMKKFDSGSVSTGTFTHIQSQTAIEALGYTGLDYVIIDMEHTALDAQTAAEYIKAAEHAGLFAFVRINEIARSPVLKMLDAGAGGIIVPCVETVDQVKRLVEYAKFAPTGDRGFCPTRDGGWGFAPNVGDGLEDYMQRANLQTLLVPQCETRGCLAHIEEIVEIEGVDGIMVGPFDLSIALQKPGQFDDPEVKSAFARVLSACKKAKKPCLIFAGGTQKAKQFIQEGYDSVILGLDVEFYINAYRDALKGLSVE